MVDRGLGESETESEALKSEREALETNQEASKSELDSIGLYLTVWCMSWVNVALSSKSRRFIRSGLFWCDDVAVPRTYREYLG